MIQRVVLVRLKPEFREPDTLAQVVEETRKTLPDAEGVRALVVGSPADERTRGEWDLTILVQLDSLDAVETYRIDKVHRAYVDVFLKPMMESIRAYNFEL